MKKKYSFLSSKSQIALLLLVILLTFCGGSTGPEIPGCEIYYFSSDNFAAGEDSTGMIVIVFENASNEDEQIETGIPDEDTTLYEENGYKLEIKSTGEVYYTRPTNGGSKTYAVNPSGIVAEHEKSGSEDTYKIRFIDQSTGEISRTANIEEGEGTWWAIFGDPINEAILVQLATDSWGNVTYQFEFDNEAGAGEISFETDPNGYITGTTYTKT
ncbi:hypothetical protein JW879_09565 [candidate division WOR-3 bacterium]|nr:hypothetical protein [candidate division WOR-3 bacterium]